MTHGARALTNPVLFVLLVLLSALTCSAHFVSPHFPHRLEPFGIGSQPTEFGQSSWASGSCGLAWAVGPAFSLRFSGQRTCPQLQRGGRPQRIDQGSRSKLGAPRAANLVRMSIGSDSDVVSLLSNAKVASCPLTVQQITGGSQTRNGQVIAVVGATNKETMPVYRVMQFLIDKVITPAIFGRRQYLSCLIWLSLLLIWQSRDTR